MRERIALLWSGGKDSALALSSLQESRRYQVAELVTSVTCDHERISMHGVRRSLLQAQAASLGLPLNVHYIPRTCTNDDYEASLTEVLEACRARGIETVAAGDIYLQDVRRYREDMLTRRAFIPLFPLWGTDTGVLASRFIERGFEATLTCVDTTQLASRFVGRSFDREFLSELPQTVDPCGENGEFHTFVHDGPLFERPIPLERGRVVLRDERFCYCDLVEVA